ncbi:MAG: hypothetical protein SNJ84_06135 [Verrucomicrobiia bacterium]
MLPLPVIIIAPLALLAPATLDPSTGREAFTRGILDALLERSSGSVWDLPASMNPRQPGAPIAIRLAEWNRPIDLGDARQLAETPGPLHLIVGFYRPKPEDNHRANLLALHEVLVSRDLWRRLWGDVGPAEVSNLVNRISTGDRVGAHNYALAEIGRLQMRGMRLVLEPRIGDQERSIACLLPFDVFYADVLGIKRAEIQPVPSLWGQPVEREFDLGAPRAIAARPPPQRRPESAEAPAPIPPPRLDVSAMPAVRIDPESGQTSIQLPTSAEQIVEALKQAPPDRLPTGVVNPPAPPPPADTGWTRIELDKPIQLGP